MSSLLAAQLCQNVRVLEIPVHNSVQGSVGKRQNRHGRVGGEVLRERRPSEHKYVVSVPVLKVRVHNGVFRRSAHDRAALNMGALIAGAIVIMQTRKTV